MLRENLRQGCTQDLTSAFVAELQDHSWVEKDQNMQNRGSSCQGKHQDERAEEGSMARMQPNLLHFLTFLAASECVMLERALFAIVQMLLVRSGVETNPGPTTTPAGSSSCCNASQHFNRVKNTIAEAHNNFRSKVRQDTLTKKVIEVEETGNSLSGLVASLLN